MGCERFLDSKKATAYITSVSDPRWDAELTVPCLLAAASKAASAYQQKMLKKLKLKRAPKDLDVSFVGIRLNGYPED